MDKIICACNSEDCDCEIVNIFIKENFIQTRKDLDTIFLSCPLCGDTMAAIEMYNEMGDLVLS